MRPAVAIGVGLWLSVVGAVAHGARTELEQPSRPAELRVLFLGNSLTAVNDLPALVQSMAASGGVRLSYRAITPGGLGLEDHWQRGEARAALAEGHWDFLVLQQGPSSRPASQANLREWAQRWADEARRYGATPALYMVWPVQSSGEAQAKAFKLVANSYRHAAEASRSHEFPVGEAWEILLHADRSVRLYQKDRLHPTLAGTYLAALVITQGLTGIPPKTIPARLKLTDGRTVELPAAQVDGLRRAAEEAIEAPRAQVAPAKVAPAP
jgi:hypothetical protein